MTEKKLTNEDLVAGARAMSSDHAAKLAIDKARTPRHPDAERPLALVRVGLPLQVPAAPGTVAYFDSDGVESIEPVIAFAVEMHERAGADGSKDYIYQTMPIGIDGAIDHFTVIAMPDGAMHHMDGTVQSLDEYKKARALAQKWK